MLDGAKNYAFFAYLGHQILSDALNEAFYVLDTDKYQSFKFLIFVTLNDLFDLDLYLEPIQVIQ